MKNKMKGVIFSRINKTKHKKRKEERK